MPKKKRKGKELNLEDLTRGPEKPVDLSVILEAILRFKLEGQLES